MGPLDPARDNLRFPNRETGMDVRNVTFPTTRPATARAVEIRQRLKEVEEHLAEHRAIIEQRQREMRKEAKDGK